jgi:hypothetical protein
MTYRTAPPPDVVLTIMSVAIVSLVSATRPLAEIAKFPDGHFEHQFQAMDHILGVFLAAKA